MTKQTKILTGLLAGAAVGAVVALALTSDRNNELKGKVGDWFCDLLDNSKEKLGAVGELVQNGLAKVRV